jgi:hypothetical protein
MPALPALSTNKYDTNEYDIRAGLTDFIGLPGMPPVW